jgi:hypothetical protein
VADDAVAVANAVGILAATEMLLLLKVMLLLGC